ncbi:MAG: MMPL family transporter [Acidimicrobiales bacterium]
MAAGLVSIALFSAGIGAPPVALVAFALAAAVLVLGFFVPGLKRRIPPRTPRPLRQTLPYRWSRMIQRHPWAALLVGSTILLALAAPVLGLRLGFSDEGNFPENTSTRRAYDLIAEGFGPGYNGPLLVTAVLDQPAAMAQVQVLQAEIAATPGVAVASPPIPNDPENPEAVLIRIVPTTSPQDLATEELVTTLREDVIPAADEGLAVSVTGGVPASIDFTSFLGARILVFFGVVLALSFLLLMAVFRSLVVPVKAVIMNVLSIAASYGIVVAIFQWGWFGDVLGIAGAPIEPFIPMMLVAIVFGLSMDYEVFLLSRIKEEYERSGDSQSSVADGLASTARVISAAAIMMVVFGRRPTTGSLGTWSNREGITRTGPGCWSVRATSAGSTPPPWIGRSLGPGSGSTPQPGGLPSVGATSSPSALPARRARGRCGRPSSTGPTCATSTSCSATGWPRW